MVAVAPYITVDPKLSHVSSLSPETGSNPGDWIIVFFVILVFIPILKFLAMPSERAN